MKIINQTVIKIPQPISYFSGDLQKFRNNSLKFLEDIGRTCYKSTSGEDTASRFVSNIVNSGHDSVIEHLYFAVEFKNTECDFSGLNYIEEDWMEKTFVDDQNHPIIIFNARGLKTAFAEDGRVCITGLIKYIKNIIPELFSEEDAKSIDSEEYNNIYPYWFNLIQYKDGFETYRIITDIGARNELVRHRRDCSYSVESSRFCSYNKDKFDGGQLTFISPDVILDLTNENDIKIFDIWCEAMKSSEYYYNYLKEFGAKNDLARGVLPQALKSELVFTCSSAQLHDHIIPIRIAKEAHPLMREMMQLIKDSDPDIYHEII